MKSKATVLCKLIKYIEEQDLVYCLVGDTSGLPNNFCGDVDFVCSTGQLKTFATVLRAFTDREEIEIVQLLKHEIVASYFVLSWLDEDNQVCYLHVDICSDYLRGGRFLLSAEDLLEGRVKTISDDKQISFFVPRPSMGFLYYLLKKIDKVSLDEEQGNYISRVWAEDPKGCMNQMSRFWQEQDLCILENAARTNKWNDLDIGHLQHSLQQKLPFSLGLFCREINRKIIRVLRPTGLFIVVLGPDGSGKTSVIDSVQDKIKVAFRRTAYFHFRPGLEKSNHQHSEPADDPHGQLPRSWLASVGKLFFYWVDYSLGYLLKIRPAMIRSTFVVFDRYFYDLMIDPRRLRYSGPKWLVRLVKQIIPKPDIVILLNARPEIVSKRKKDLSFKEVVRQQKAFLNFVNKVQNSCVIDASGPLDDVVTDTSRAILKHMSEKIKYKG